MSDIVVGLDIGTSSIRTAIGEISESNDIEIIGLAKVPSAGLRNGVIVNIEAAQGAIRQAIEIAEQEAGVDVSSCYTAIGGSQIEGINSKGVVGVSSKGNTPKEITQNDINRVIESANAVQIPMDREMLHVIPQDFIVDGIRSKEPVHMMGVRLEGEVHVITASKTTIQNVRSCIERAGYEIERVMLKTLSAVKAVAHDDELELGSILIDLGAGSTDVLVLINGAPVCTLSIMAGGNLVTSDISIVKGIPISAAERIKLESGCCWLPFLTEPKEVVIPGVGGRPPELTTQVELCNIIQPRMEEIFMMVKRAIVHKSDLRQLSGNIILTGGGAQMEGVVELAQQIFGTTAVRLGIPEKLGGDEDKYRTPEYATVIGLLQEQKAASSDNGRGRALKKTDKAKGESFFAKIAKIKKAFF